MLRDGRARVSWLAIVLGLLVASAGLVVFIYYPFNPTITVTFRVATTSGYSITMGPTAYVKASSFGSVGVPQGQVLLSHLDTTTGPLGLSIVIRYGISTLSSQNFTMISEGGYQMKVLYGSRSEITTIPYTIAMTLLSTSSQVLVTSNVTVFPN